ncbi:chemotaxis response regulator protein-glutamate methylesterase [Thauera aromatica]|uniref:protein-glutamate methylesterase/protein-glutamine glutaminase n=1 Tax=Thauera aromatica TaxID=59405 RepID=UPI001FFD60A5|nr:chemotaxis response regulator protein-glutamate methylesterase [Thauera aromatica]MCK2086743.1 chemotaxis response regulator protein-glutamate methylesterase [Thauera aromatica]
MSAVVGEAGSRGAHNPIRVLIVDDSAVVRQVMGEVLRRAPGIEVIATASDPVFALDKMRQAWPDVILLDVEMPRMDGITFLKRIMAERPTPVIICSTLTSRGAETTMQALAAGAVSIITKPTLGLKHFLNDSAAELVGAVRSAARANMRAMKLAAATPGREGTLAPAAAAGGARPAPGAGHEALAETTDRLIAIGTSTGGTQALEVVLRALPRTIPGIVVVQHMPEKFTELFAQRLNQVCAIEVLEAQDGQRVIAGRALIAPGGRHLTVRRSGAHYLVEVRDGPPVNRHRPSVDVLFRSVARYAGRNAMGVIMTGMGDDGARGLRELFDAGATTVAQDEASSVVFGMPKEAIRLGAAGRVLGLEAIAPALIQYGRQCES